MASFIFEHGTMLRVICAEISDGRFVLTSIRRGDPSKGNKVASLTSFLVCNKEKTRTVEWEPEYGPISVNTRSEEGTRMDPVIGTCENDWTQLAVDERGLPGLAINRRYEQIFAVLESYL